ncbi:MAG: acetylglutamate kinase [Parcubacteria group bacterium Gr01-1014_31]|nr:MAG: acetylglutamate kinase [Parcubacteria group bacterium Gr01-1014_31]
MNGNEVNTLLQALPYMRHHNGATFVVKCGGEIARDATSLDGLSRDLALCIHVGIRIVLVHGGGPQASELSERLGMEPVKVAGRRITDHETLEVAKMVFGGSINIDILSALRRHGLQAVGLSGVDGGIVHAVKRPPTMVDDPESGGKREVDFGLVGDITAVNVGLLQYLISGGYVPVVSSLGGDDAGHIFNINADTVAAQVAVALKAHKLVMLTDAPGLMANFPDPASLVRHITVPGCEQLLHDGKITGGMVPKVETLLVAVRGGVPRAHILDGKTPHALLLELFTKDGAGTMVTSREEEKRYLGE